MQGVQVAPAINDENSTRGSLLHSAFKENSSSLQASGKPGSTLKTVRKAFGNITNTRCDASSQQAGGTVVKRRFGQDITNSAIKEPNAATTKKPPLATQIRPSSKSSAPEVAPATAAAPVAAPWWETAEPERPAGKTWEQLEADRLREEDEDIERDVQQLVAGLRGPLLFKSMFGIGADRDTDEDLNPGPPPPMPDSIRDAVPNAKQQMQIGSGPIVFDYPGKDNFLDLLPDIELTWPDPDVTLAAVEPVAHPAEDVSLQQPSDIATSSMSMALQQDNLDVGSRCSAFMADDVHGLAQHQHAREQEYISCRSPATAKSAAIDPAAHLRSPETLPW